MRAGVADWDAFNSEILRGKPSLEFRLASMTARTRLPEGPRGGGGIFELQKPLKEKPLGEAESAKL